MWCFVFIIKFVIYLMLFNLQNQRLARNTTIQIFGISYSAGVHDRGLLIETEKFIFQINAVWTFYSSNNPEKKKSQRY